MMDVQLNFCNQNDIRYSKSGVLYFGFEACSHYEALIVLELTM